MKKGASETKNDFSISERVNHKSEALMKPKSMRGFIFFIIATLVFFEFGNTIRNIAAKYPLDNALFSLVTARNSGGAWNILENHTVFLTVLGFAALLLLAFYVWKKVDFTDREVLLSAVLFSAGILGNTAERLVNGHVIDYIKLKFINFPVFNSFDIMICVGVALYATHLIFGCKQNESK